MPGPTLGCRVVMFALLSAAARQATAQSQSDSSFAALQARGAVVMGVDQYSSHHVFEDLEGGGRIILVRDDPTDTAGAEAIRQHLRGVAHSFARGIFSDPSRVHAREVPGTAELARLRDQIRYQVSDRAGGAELRITTMEPAAIAALRRFLAFQREDHHATAHEGMQQEHVP